jgi:hypothetical protein
MNQRSVAVDFGEGIVNEWFHQDGEEFPFRTYRRPRRQF